MHDLRILCSYNYCILIVTFPACKADMMCFIRAVLQSFLNNVNPTESGLKDVLIQNNIISITDEEWLDGNDVPTTRDKVRDI